MMTENFKTGFRKPNPTGYLVLDFPHGPMTVVGGPFDAYIAGIGVCLEEESALAGEAQILFPIHDFTAPKVEDLERLIADIIVAHAAEPNEPVFVGCRGGFGRTGTVVAALVKYAQEMTAEEGDALLDPIKYTRQNFNPNAVETQPQANVVRALNVNTVLELVEGMRGDEKAPEVVETVVDPNAGLNFFQRAARNFLDLVWG
jgi:hypothetical protein